MSRNLKRAAPFAVLATAVFWWACGPETQSPVEPLDSITPEFFTGVKGAAFTTFNPWVDGDSKDVCKNSIINCNIYGAKEFVWLNGGPAANGLRPDGDYFFAVLEPGGQPNPNDGAPKNLSIYTTWEERTFTITDGEVSDYEGPHDLDSGNTLDPDRKTCKSPHGCTPDGEPPFIRLFPYEDTSNPGGVYIMAICTLDNGYPVEPRDCKYDAFKVREGKITVQFMLAGIKFEDKDADGSPQETGEPQLPGWTITITGTGFAGEEINASVLTGPDGAWMYESEEYSFGPRDPVQNADLTICEEVLPGWYQSFPDPACHEVIVEPAAAVFIPGLDFGNFRPVDITAKKFYDRLMNGVKDEGEEWIADFQFCLYDEGGAYVDAGDFVKDPDPACQKTDNYGTVTWDNLFPGTYTVKEEDAAYWIPTTPTSATFTLLSGESALAKFGNVLVCDGLTPGYWSNWRNHYTEAEFLVLLEGTIAEGDIDLADFYLNSIGCDDGDALHCLRRFLLANQLTLNLTQQLGFFNGDDAELYPVCQLEKVDGNLAYWLGVALDFHDGTTPFDRDQVIYVKTVLDWFANMNVRPSM